MTGVGVWRDDGGVCGGMTGVGVSAVPLFSAGVGVSAVPLFSAGAGVSAVSLYQRGGIICACAPGLFLLNIL